MFDGFKALKREKALEEEFESLKRDFHSLQADWELHREKALRMFQRITKRAEMLQKEEEGGEKELSDSEVALLDPRNASPIWGKLTPRQKQIQTNIMRRRANGGGQ